MTRHRRQFLRLCGVAGFGALAGCSICSQDDEPSPGEQPTSAPETSPQTPVQQAKLVPDDGDSGDTFGSPVSLSADGTTALIGAYQDEDPNGENAGSAYVFAKTDESWRQQAKLSAADGDSGDGFVAGELSSDGTTALVGAPHDENPNGAGAGSAYVFDGESGSWRQRAKLTPDDGDSEDYFGFWTALSSDGTTALISARFDEDPNGERAGSAYVFTL